MEIRIMSNDEEETRMDAYRAVGKFIEEFILKETKEAYINAYERGYNDGHKDGIKETVTTIKD